MNEFDIKAAGWDDNPMHLERSKAIAAKLLEMIPVREGMTALEFGAGTGLLSFELREKFLFITLLDSSKEMVRIMDEKIASRGIQNMKAHVLDLEKEEFTGHFDIIFTQMVFHHVGDIGSVLRKFHALLKPGGYLAIADLYPEDGSFHDDSFNGHRGFDADKLAGTLAGIGFTGIRHEKCFVIRKTGDDQVIKDYPVFLMKGIVK